MKIKNNKERVSLGFSKNSRRRTRIRYKIIER